MGSSTGRTSIALFTALVLATSSACGNRASYESQLTAQSPARQDQVVPVGSNGERGGGAAPATSDLRVAPSAGTAPGPQSASPLTSDPATDPVSTSKCTGNEKDIVIGTVGHQSGVAGAALGGGPKAVQAWAALMNSRGGLGCHKVRYIIADDGGDPARHQALVQQLVEQQKVIAFVQMNATLSGQSSITYLNRKRIPVIGTEGGSAWVYDHPIYFPQGSSGDLLLGGGYFAVGQVAREQGKTKLAVVACIETTICSRTLDVADRFAGPAGMTVTYKGSASLVQPDYTSQCLNARNSGAEILLLSFEVNGLKRFAASCASVGYRPILGTTASAAGADFPNDPNLDGMVVGMNSLPWFVTTNPGIAEYHAALQRFAPGVVPGPGGVIGWVAAKLLETAASDLPDQPTSEAVLNGLWGIRGDDLGGLAPPLTFNRDQNPSEQFCWWSARVEGGTWISPNGAERTCQ